MCLQTYFTFIEFSLVLWRMCWLLELWFSHYFPSSFEYYSIVFSLKASWCWEIDYNWMKAIEVGKLITIESNRGQVFFKDFPFDSEASTFYPDEPNGAFLFFSFIPFGERWALSLCILNPSKNYWLPFLQYFSILSFVGP